MKKIISILVFALLCTTVFAQQKQAAEKLVAEGIEYHDKGDYKGAISKYDQALELDKDNLVALVEKSITLSSLQKYDEAIVYCQRAIEKHSDSNILADVYVTYGNAYDGLQKTDQSIEMYDKGIKEFPNYYQLHFNKGIALINAKKYNDAIACFQQSAYLNPQHASSHNALGRLLFVNKKRIPAILAYSRFLVLEPEGKRAIENVAGLEAILNGDVEKTGKNSISIHIDSEMFGDTTADGKPKENSFATVDLLLSLTAGLDHNPKQKKETEVEQFIRKFETICSSLKETQKDNYGFYWDFYVPYFIDMSDQKLIKTFVYIALASSDYPGVNKWLTSHKKEVEHFYKWSSDFTWKSDER